ncbi:MAG: hypothetical protein IT450_03540 [Phycisphaerales bacterium]|nr:hypothetical protein [Phycisphaerales bacterium]
MIIIQGFVMRNRIAAVVVSAAHFLFAFSAGPCFAQTASGNLSLHAHQSFVLRATPEQPLVARSVVVDGCDSVTIEVSTPIDTVAVSVTAPQGEIIDPTTISQFGGTYLAFHEDQSGQAELFWPMSGVGYQQILRFEPPDAGSYVLHMQVTSVMTEDVPIMTTVFTDSPVRVAILTTSAVVPSASPLAISVAVFEGAAPVTGATIVAHVKATDFSDPETAFALLDAAGDGDAEAGDGLYSGVYTPTRTGPHYIVAEITGTRADSTPFTRQAATQFRVVSTGASFAGNLTDHGVDTNSNGWYEFVQFDQPVTVTTNDRFGLSVFGHTAGGETIYGVGNATLAAGNRVVWAQIRTADFLATGENGPYLVDRIELTRRDPDLGYVTIARQVFDPPYQTGAYQWTQFERPAIQFLGMVSDNGVDTDADGKFDVLRVVLNVNVRTPGLFKIGGQIADGCNRRIAWGDAQQTLAANQPQQIVLDFPGTDIGKHAVAGPYKVRSLTLARLGSSPPESLIVNTVGQTGYYQASAFEGVSSGNVDCNANGQPDDCECLGDMNGDHQVSIVDLAVFLSSFGLCTGQPGFNAAADYDGNGCVSLSDYTCFLGRFGGNCW